MFYDKNESNKDFNRSRLASRQFFSHLFPCRLVSPTKLETRHARSNREDRALFIADIVFADVPNRSIRDRVGSLDSIDPDGSVRCLRPSSVLAAFRSQRSSPDAFPIDARSVVALVALLLASADPLSTASEAFLPHFFTTVTRHVRLTRFTPQILQRQKRGTLVSAANAAKRIEEIRRVCDERIGATKDGSPFRFAPRSASRSISNSTTYRGFDLPRTFGETIDDTWDESGSRSTRRTSWEHDLRDGRRVAKTAAVVAVASIGRKRRPLALYLDSTIDTVAGPAVVAPAAAGTRCLSPVGSAGSADRPASIAGLRPVVADTTAVVHDALAEEADAPPGPSPRASCPALPASLATCI